MSLRAQASAIFKVLDKNICVKKKEYVCVIFLLNIYECVYIYVFSFLLRKQF